MKFVHLADLHIGRRFGEYPMLHDQRFALDAVLQSVSRLKPDAAFIAGDVYDKSVPSEEAVELADDFFTKLLDIVPRVLVISGNHDSQRRLSFASRITSQRGLYVSRAFTGKLERATVAGASVWLMPHIRPREASGFLAEPSADTQEVIERIINTIPPCERDIILSHQFVVSPAGVERCDSEVEPVGGLNAVDAGVFGDFKYAALGHLHKPQKVGSEAVRYAGSLLKYSFSETNHKKSFVYGELDGAGLKTELIHIPCLRDARTVRGTLEELLSLAGNKDDYIDAVLTDEILPLSPGFRLGRVYDRLVNVSWRPPAMEANAPESAYRDESPKEMLNGFFQRMNAREMSDKESAYISELWRSVGEELGK